MPCQRKSNHRTWKYWGKTRLKRQTKDFKHLKGCHLKRLYACPKGKGGC